MHVREDEPRAGPSSEVQIVAVDGGSAAVRFDRVATEEPLEIRLRAGNDSRSVAVTMRTPGNDFELSAGFLYCEGVMAHQRDLRRISYCVDVDVAQRVEKSGLILERFDAPKADHAGTSPRRMRRSTGLVGADPRDDNRH